MTKVEIWTDGSYNPNTGVGSWAYIVNGKTIISGSNVSTESHTDNIRMELKAIVEGLKEVDEQVSIVEVYSDCQFILNSMKNFDNWERKDWRVSKGKGKLGVKIKNVDLWMELNKLLKNVKFEIRFNWIKGHSGIEFNVKVDQIASKTRKNYEKILKNSLHSLECMV